MPPAASAESMVDIPRGHLFFKLQYLYNTNGGHSLRLIDMVHPSPHQLLKQPVQGDLYASAHSLP